MKCFNHHDRDAFGICKACGKALCLECMDANSKEVVCANDIDCQKRNSVNIDLIKNTVVYYSPKSIAKMCLSGIAFLVLGFILLLLYLTKLLSAPGLFVGVFFMIIGCSIIKRSKELIPVGKSEDRSSVGKSFIKYVCGIFIIFVIVFLISLFM